MTNFNPDIKPLKATCIFPDCPIEVARKGKACKRHQYFLKREKE